MKTNQCYLVGNLGADPVERGRSEKAGPIVGFSIAENVNSFDKETKKYKTIHTNWFQVTTFGTIAERAKAALKKGDRIAVQGRLQTTRYKTKTGEERSGFEIIADDITLCQPLPSSRSASSADEGSDAHEHSDSHGAMAEESLPF